MDRVQGDYIEMSKEQWAAQTVTSTATNFIERNRSITNDVLSAEVQISSVIICRIIHLSELKTLDLITAV